MQERRAHPRVKGPFEGWWDSGGPQDGRIVDLSVAGCYIESPVHPMPGQHIMISVRLAAGSVVEVPAEVLRGEPRRGFAARFLPMPDGVREILRAEVDRRLQG